MNNPHLSDLKPIIQCECLTKVFKEGIYSRTVLEQLDFSLYPEERIAITGASGSGKSTLLHILGCLDNPTHGIVRVLNQPITHCNHQQLNQIRNRYIGFIYQFHHLLPEFSLIENVALPLLIQGEKLDIAEQKAIETLTELGLIERAHYKPTHVSGGERQRTAIARAMSTEPLFILADEPTGNLDSTTAHRIIDVLLKFQKTSLIVITHDEAIAQRMDKILRLEQGHLIRVDK